ncbi:MAG: tetratricopeptide repeat protein [Pirellulales bacterium]|nr:tetratricopeptide repeat protein [Pirellulales bacterium]
MTASNRNASPISTAARLSAACLLLFVLGCSDADQTNKAAGNPAVAAPPVSQAAAAAPAEVAAGKQALEAGDYEEAVDRFTRAIVASEKTETPSANAEAAQVYFDRGVAYLKMGFPDTAAQDFSTAINLAPHDGAAFEQRARANVALGDAYKSLRDATQAIRLTPNNAGAYHIRGVVYLNRGEFDRATADLQQAIDQNPALLDEVRPQLVEALADWAEQLAANGDSATAAEKLARARELDPTFVAEETVIVVEKPAVEQTVAKPVLDEAEKSYVLGREHQAEQAYDQAIIEYTKAIALRPDFHNAYLRRGETLLALGFPDTALEDLKRAVNRGAESAEPYRLQAQAHMAMKNPHRAALSATDALHADPTDAATYALRGEAYLQLENWDRAIADLNEAIRRDSKLREALKDDLEKALKGRAMTAQGKSADGGRSPG